MSPDANNSPTSHSANYGQCGSDVHTSVYSCVYDCNSYASFVIPVLTYNMGTWGLTQADLDRIDTYHRRHLRQIIGVERGSLPPLPMSTHQRVHRNSKMAAIRSRAAFAERCPRPNSYRPLLRRHRSSRLQRSTADIPAHDFVLGPATHWSHTTPACRHRSSPRT